MIYLGMNKAITVRNLKKTFSVKKRQIVAVNGISFQINEGDLVGFIGKNGAGKTTTMKCLSGLLAPDSGEVEVLGFTPSKRRYQFLQRISMVMGNRSQLWWELPAIDSFLLNKEIYQIENTKYKSVLNEMVRRLDIKQLLDIPVRKLSLGERMKCELICSLLHTPDLVFLDEPTLGLDLISQKNLRDFLEDYHRNYGSTIILTSHNMEDIKDLCNRVIIIDEGNILYDDSLSELASKFVKKKNIHFVFPKKIELREIEKYGDIVDFDGKEGTISVPVGDVRSVATKLLEEYEVEDIDIGEMGLEDIVRNIFSKKSV